MTNMSIIQSFIASSYAGDFGPPPPNWMYPPIGNNYPAIAGVAGANQPAIAVSGYYEASSLATTPNLGLWRFTYDNQQALDASYQIDSNFPNGYNQVQSMPDQFVGFGFDLDVATSFTMQWLGYFKPAQSGDFVFRMDVDDYAMMWIGQAAVSGFNASNAILQANNSDVSTLKYTLSADKYYPVRIIYSENQGGHKCCVWSGLNDTVMQHNADTASTGQFWNDQNSGFGTFPSTGLIT